MAALPTDETTPWVTYVVTLEDTKAFWAALKRRKPPRRSSAIWTAVFYLAVFLGLCDVLRMQIEDAQPSVIGTAIAGVLVGIFGLLALAVVWNVAAAPRTQRRVFDGMLVSRASIAARCDAAGVEVRQAGIVSTYPWESFIDMRATPSLFLLLVARETAVIVPRRAVSGTPFGTLVEARCAHGVTAPWNP